MTNDFIRLFRMKTFLKTVLVFLFAVFPAVWAMAQVQDDDEDGPVANRIKSAKIGLITNRLNLTPEQSKQFWPVYDAYEAERKKIRQQIRKLRINANTMTATDDEVRGDLKEMMSLRQKEVDLEKDYMNKFLKVITPRQVVALYKSEKEFNGLLLEEIRKRRMERKNGR